MNTKIVTRTGIVVGLLLGVGLIQFYLSKTKAENSIKIQKNKDAELLEKKKTQALKIKTKPTATKEPKKELSLFPFKIGDSNKQVTELQMYLLKNHGWAQVTMGTYDKVTQNRVKQFLKIKEVTKSAYDMLMEKSKKEQWKRNEA